MEELIDNLEHAPPKQVRSRYLYMIGLLDCLRALGPINPQRAYDWLIEAGIARDEDRTKLQQDGGSRFKKEARWARQELLHAGLVMSPSKGIWALTEAGASTFLTPAGAKAIAYSHSTHKWAASENDDLQRESFAPTTGPIPVEWSGTVTRALRGPCWTYATRFGDTLVWKIGLANNVDQRAIELNRHLPHEIVEHRWRPLIRHPWPDARAAYAMEQFVLIELRDVRTSGERVLCTEERVRAAWQAALETLNN